MEMSTPYYRNFPCIPLFFCLVPVTGLDLHFRPLSKNKGSAASSRSGQRSSTLHLDRFDPSPLRKKRRQSEVGGHRTADEGSDGLSARSGGQKVRKPPVLELVAATPHRGVAFNRFESLTSAKKTPDRECGQAFFGRG